MHILFVEEDQAILEKMATYFGDEKWNISVANDGAAALEILEEEPIDILVTALNLPIVDGIGLLKYTRQHYDHIDVVIVSGSPDVNTTLEAIRYRAAAFLSKPFLLGDLKSEIKKIEKTNLQRQHFPHPAFGKDYGEKLLRELTEESENISRQAQRLYTELNPSQLEKGKESDWRSILDNIRDSSKKISQISDKIFSQEES